MSASVDPVPREARPFQGARLHPLGALARAAFYVIFPIGLLWVLVSGQNRSLQDLVLRTSVIYDWDVHPFTAIAGPDAGLSITHD